MSYCRFSEGDVNAYECDGGVQFWVAGEKLDRLCNTYGSAYQYAKYLRGKGFDVPSHAIEALRADALEEANHGDGSVVAELVSENAKLRKLAQRSYYIVMSERAALDTQGINPDDGVYMTALDKEIDKMKETMLELGIENTYD